MLYKHPGPAYQLSMSTYVINMAYTREMTFNGYRGLGVNSGFMQYHSDRFVCMTRFTVWREVGLRNWLLPFYDKYWTCELFAVSCHSVMFVCRCNFKQRILLNWYCRLLYTQIDGVAIWYLRLSADLRKNCLSTFLKISYRNSSLLVT